MTKKLTPEEKRERQKLREARKIQEFWEMEKAKAELVAELNAIYNPNLAMLKDKLGFDIPLI